MTPRIGSLFSGIGGLDLAVESFLGGETVWHCEVDPEPSRVLAARWPGVPNLGDITTVDWATVPPVDVLCGGFPCQDLSLAGRRKGMRPGTRSGLWADFVTAIRALKPSVVIIENVRGLLSGCAESDSDVEPCPGCVADGGGVPHAPRIRALGRVLGDLDALGFDAEWHGLRASDVGAPHGRFRVFMLAYARGIRLDERWDAASRQAAGGRASTVTGGRGRAPVTLLPTPTTQPETGNGRARNLGKEIVLLPTPSAAEFDGDPEVFMERAARMKKLGINGNGAGMPLAIAVQTLLPTPVTTDAKGARNSTAQRTKRGAHSGVTLTDALVTTPRADDAQGNVTGTVSWGEYEPAVRRWESITRTAPAPTRPDGKGGRHRLSPLLSEWMMGYPDGWVTDILGRDASIRACGNGVVPHQAFTALTILWARVLEWIEAAA